MRSLSSPRWAANLLLAGALCLGTTARAASPGSYSQPQAAADALVAAVAANDTAAMQRLLGPEWRKLLPPQGVDPDDRQAFLDQARASTNVKLGDGRADMVIGKEGWVFPVPLVQTKDGQWRFDPRGGREAILERRIGSNERAAILAALAYVDAQREYAQADRNGDGLLEYAQKFISSPGKRDGLIWSPALGDDSPLGEAFLPPRAGVGYHGYRFKILTAQGPAARGGARSYLIGKRLTNGYALVAWPVRYADTGVMTFIVNQEGVVYQRDFGPQTAKDAANIARFDPAEGWTQTQP